MNVAGILFSRKRSIALMPACRRFELHLVRTALALALAREGTNNAARIAITAITTSSSTSVNARNAVLFEDPLIAQSWTKLLFQSSQASSATSCVRALCHLTSFYLDRDIYQFFMLSERLLVSAR